MAWSVSDKNHERELGWQSGTAGIALAFLRAYEITGEVKWRDIGTSALRGIPRWLVMTDYSQATGLSGIGEVYLEALRITGHSEWRDKADWIARFLIDMRFDHGDESWWLVGNLRFPTADLMVGNSGILHFLLRYAFPGQLSYPMLPDILDTAADPRKLPSHV
jgi:lantibiotic modifying enzyme